MPRHSGHTQPVAKNRRQSLRPAHDSDLRQSWGDDARSLLQTSLAATDRGQSIVAGEAGTGGLRSPSGPRPGISPVNNTAGGTAGMFGGRVAEGESLESLSPVTPAKLPGRPSPKTRRARALREQKGAAA